MPFDTAYKDWEESSSVLQNNIAQLFNELEK